MSAELIKKLNSISYGNLSDPMFVRMDDWNKAMDEVRSVLSELTAARDEAERLRGRVSELERTPPYVMAYMYRKQAEAVEDATKLCQIKSATEDSKCYSDALFYYAKSLRAHADELEKDHDPN